MSDPPVAPISLRELCDHIPNGIVYHATGRLGEPLRFVYVSAGVERTLGVTPARVQADPAVLYDGIHDEDRGVMFAAMEYAARTGEPLDCTYRHRVGDDVRWLHCRAFPSARPDGEVSWVGLVIDETPMKRLELALAAGEARFRAFMDHSPAMAWMKDADGRYVYMSRTTEERLGVREADCLGRTDAHLWPGPNAREYLENDQRVLAEDRPIETIEPSVSADGTQTRWLSLKFPFNDGDNRFVGGVAVDITARERAETEMRRKNEELQAALDKVRRLETSLVTMCAWTRTVRHEGQWVSVEQFLREKFGVEVSHGISDAALRGMRDENLELRDGRGASGTSHDGAG